MNSIQLAAFAHLAEGGEDSARAGALTMLQERDFFRSTDEEQSRVDIVEFIESVHENGDFCSDGIGRFSVAVLGENVLDKPSGPTTNRLIVTLHVDVTNEHGLPREYDDAENVGHDIGDAVAKIAGLAQGVTLGSAPWKVDSCRMEDAYWD